MLCIKFSPWLDSNIGPLVSDVTDLLSESQLPTALYLYWFKPQLFGAIPYLFFKLVFSTINRNWIWPMTGFEPVTSSFRSYRSANWATTDAPNKGQYFCGLDHDSIKTNFPGMAKSKKRIEAKIILDRIYTRRRRRLALFAFDINHRKCVN